MAIRDTDVGVTTKMAFLNALGFLAALASSAIILFAAPHSASAAWSTPVNAASSTTLRLNGPEQTVLDNGVSVVGWTQDNYSSGPSSSSLIATSQSREGGAPGPPITVASSSSSSGIWDFEVASLGSSAAIIWVTREFPSSSIETFTVWSRTMSPSGVLGPLNQIDTASVDETLGRLNVAGLSASTGGGLASVAWSQTGIQGPASSNCERSGSYSSPTPGTSCTTLRKVRFAQLNSSGAIAVPAKDVYAQQFVSERGINCSSYELSSYAYATSTQGNATIIIEDGCYLLSGDPEEATLFSRVAPDGSASQAELLRLDRYSVSDGTTDGTTVVAFGDRLYRIPNTGTPTGPVLSINDSETSGTDLPADDVLALPKGEALALWTSSESSSSGLTRSAWARRIAADGSLGEPSQIYSKTLPATAAQGPTRYSYLYQIAAIGKGRDTGTTSIVSYLYDRPNATAAAESLEVSAVGLDREGKKEAGTESTLVTRNSSFNPSTTYGNTYASPLVDVGPDGTASAALLTGSYRYTSPDPATFQDILTLSKLTRNSNTCGVTPSLCKAKLKVQKVSLAPKKLRAGKKATLSITLRNTGTADAAKATAKISASSKLVKVPKKVTFKNVVEGSNSSKKVTIRVKPGLSKGKITVKVGSSKKKISFKAG